MHLPVWTWLAVEAGKPQVIMLIAERVDELTLTGLREDIVAVLPGVNKVVRAVEP